MLTFDRSAFSYEHIRFFLVQLKDQPPAATFKVAAGLFLGGY